MAPGYGLPKVLRFYEQLSSINKKLEAAYQKLKQKWCSSRRFFQYKVDAEPIETCPSVDTVMLALLLLLLYFFALAVVALVIPNDHVKWTVIGVGTAFVILLSIVFGTDVYGKTVRKQERKYSRNLANTVLTVLFTTFVLTAMYGVFWHDKLNEVIIRRNEDVVPKPEFPAVAFLQRWKHSQANIVIGELKCWIGSDFDTAARCSSYPVDKVPYSCDCGDNWPSVERIERGVNTITWFNRTTAYYPMVPKESSISRGAGHFMTIQVFFSYNQTESMNNQSQTAAPGIWIAFYDPSYNITELLPSGEAYILEIDANSRTVVNIGLQYYEYLTKRPRYIYDVAMSVRQNLGLVCDVDDPFWYLCNLSVEIQIPSFIRTIVKQEKKYHWSEVIAEAGSYFALVQFLSWIISGAAWVGDP